jgi:hypothetical protein
MSNSNLKFYWNGVKANGGKLQLAHYSKGNYTPESGLCNDTITVYGRHYNSFSAEVRAAFTVVNNSDSMTDYFEQDRIRVAPEHPLYAQVRAAYDKQDAHRDRMCTRRGL